MSRILLAMALSTSVLAGAQGIAVPESQAAERFAPAPPAEAEFDPAEASIEQVRYVMGTLWTVEARGPGARQAVEAAFAEIARLDRSLSTYKADSELSRVNREGARGWVPVSDETRDLVSRALGLARESGGAFDPTVGPLVELWGFKHQRYRFPSEAEIAETRRRVGHGHVAVDPVRGIRFAREGVTLDLGAIAKGYAVDRAVAILRERGMRTVRVDAGGNQGVWGVPPEGKRWVFGIKHPRQDGAILGLTTLEAGSVSTSGDAERGFWKDGERYGHLLDPRTGRPIKGVVSVTVLAADAERADALSTTLAVLGPDEGLALLKRVRGAEALWVLESGKDRVLEVRRSAGFPWFPVGNEGRVTLKG